MARYQISVGLVLLLAGCGSEPSVPAASVQDSAGVTVVESSAASWREGSEWRLASTPDVDIGGIDADSEYQLFQVRSAVRLADGSIVVANAGSAELRFYDAAGNHVQNVGRRGGGPGEFEDLRWVARYSSDSLLAWDVRLRRGSVYGLSGQFHRSFTLPAEAFYVPVASFPDGTLLTRETSQWMTQEILDGAQRPSIALATFSVDGEKIADLGGFPEDEYWSESGPDHPHRWRRAFGRRTAITVSDSLIFIGTGEVFSVDGYSRSGHLLRRLRYVGFAPATVSAEDHNIWLEETLATVEPNMAEHMRPFFENIQPRTTLPPYDRVLTDVVGNLWVEHYRRPGDEKHTWTVFNEKGFVLGQVGVPGGFDILEVGTDYVLGRWLDDLDVEHIQLYRLLKGAGAAKS
jgi:hypothetical protein